MHSSAQLSTTERGATTNWMPGSSFKRCLRKLKDWSVLPQAHVIGKHTAKTTVGEEDHPVKALLLVFAEGRVDARGQIDGGDLSAALSQLRQVNGGRIQFHGATTFSKANGEGCCVTLHLYLGGVGLFDARQTQRGYDNALTIRR